MQVVGLDIGYSNLKLAFARAGTKPDIRVLPAMAAPIEHVAVQLEGTSRASPSGIPVRLDGQDWVAGVRPTRISGWSRALHARYADSDAYRALVLAALTLVNAPRIDRLVTGLPVAQAVDIKQREALRGRLLGRHATGIGVVEVAEVRVIAQPVGTFVDALVQGDEALIGVISEGTVLILDVGFFSVDWAVLVQGDLRRTATGTSLEAMSVVIETAAGLIGAEGSGQPPVAVIERALAEGRMSILYQGRRVDLLPALQQASTETARIALEALRQDLRREQTAVDRILVTGGGSAWFMPLVSELFDPVPVEIQRAQAKHLMPALRTLLPPIQEAAVQAPPLGPIMEVQINWRPGRAPVVIGGPYIVNHLASIIQQTDKRQREPARRVQAGEAGRAGARSS